MDRATLISRLNEGEPAYKLTGDLRKLPGPDAGRIVWEVIDAGEAPAVASSSEPST